MKSDPNSTRIGTLQSTLVRKCSVGRDLCGLLGEEPTMLNQSILNEKGLPARLQGVGGLVYASKAGDISVNYFPQVTLCLC